MRAVQIEPLEQRSLFAVVPGVDERFIGPLQPQEYVAWLEARAAEPTVPDNNGNSSPDLPAPPAPAPAPPQTPAPINVRDFGAVGNGVKDDTTALKAAVSALKAAGPGHVLLLPTGVYRISSTINFNGMSDFTVRGENATIKALGSMGVNISKGDVFSFSNSSAFTVEGLTLNGNRTARGDGTNVTLRVLGSSDFLVRDCTLIDATFDHIYVGSVHVEGKPIIRSHDGRFENCTLDNAYRNGISVISGYDLHFVGNTIRNVVDQMGIDLEPNAKDGPGSITDIEIADNIFENTANFAVYAPSLYPPSNVTLSGNIVSGTPTAFVLNGDGHQILNNTFNGINAAELGIAVAGDDALIEGNTVRNGRLAAIYTAGSGNVIRANTIIDYGFADTGECIHTTSGLGGGLIEDNTIRKTVVDDDWEPIESHAGDSVRNNYRYGVAGSDGLF